jgi:hypothetical protein
MLDVSARISDVKYVPTEEEISLAVAFVDNNSQPALNEILEDAHNTALAEAHDGQGEKVADLVEEYLNEKE